MAVGVLVALAAEPCGGRPSTASVVGQALPPRPRPAPAIDAHDGSVVQDGGTYWIFGTAYGCGFGLNRVGTRWCGINAFSSTDLQTWTPGGQAVAPDALWQQRCAPPRFGCFRPHVARAPATGLWVMWVNTYDIAAGYHVLTAPSPAGPWTESATPSLALSGRTLPSRGDHDVFVDTAGVGWIAYPIIDREVPADVAVERLNPELTSGTGEMVRLPLGFVEAPSLFERAGRVLMIFSDPACPYCGAATGLASAPLDQYRAIAVAALADAPWDRVSTLLLPATDMTIAGIVKHLAWAEDRWSQGRLVGAEMPPPWNRPGADDPNQSMRLGPGDTVDGIGQLYESARGRSRDAIARCRSLDHLAAVPSFGKGPVNLRWILVHMIDETARHAGHLDLLRDALTNE